MSDSEVDEKKLSRGQRKRLQKKQNWRVKQEAIIKMSERARPDVRSVEYIFCLMDVILTFFVIQLIL